MLQQCNKEVSRGMLTKKNADVYQDNRLREFKTCELVDELKLREGVKLHIAEPYTKLSLPVYGPAVVLVVTD